MSLSAAIDLAVRQQLAAENRPPPQTYQEAMDGIYKYTATTLRSFLIGVASRLANDTPSYKFNWNALDPDTCVTDTVQVLEGAIASETTVASAS